MSAVAGRFLVTHVDDGSAVIQAVETGRVYTLTENPGVAAGDVIAAALSPADAMASLWTVDDYDPYPLEIVAAGEPPTAAARSAVAGGAPGTLERVERSWGELHAMTVPDAATAIEDIRDDPATRSRAARLGAHRVVIRGGDGVVSVQYRTEDTR